VVTLVVEALAVSGCRGAVEAVIVDPLLCRVTAIANTTSVKAVFQALRPAQIEGVFWYTCIFTRVSQHEVTGKYILTWNNHKLRYTVLALRSLFGAGLGIILGGN
jgi:hypothetical protein